MKKNCLPIAIASLCLTSLLPIQSVSAANPWFVGVGIGGGWINLPNSTTLANGVIAPPPFNQDRLSIHTNNTSQFQFSAGYAWESQQYFMPLKSIFIQYRHYNDVNITGTIQQFSLPEFTNYNYKLIYRADLVTIGTKINLMNVKSFSPYLSPSIGFVINHLNSYSETALPAVTPRISPNYNGNIATHFAAAVGVGLDYKVNERVTMTVGYDHVFQDKANTGPGEGSWSDTRITIGNINLDTVFASLTYHLS
jgi:opacity protein-like surface antigen